MNNTNLIFKIFTIVAICVDILFATYFVVCGVLTLIHQIVFSQTQFVVLCVAVALNVGFLIYATTMLLLHKK